MVGSPDTVRRGVAAFVARTGVDELMVVSAIYDHAARKRCFETLAQAGGSPQSLIGNPLPAGVLPPGP